MRFLAFFTLIAGLVCGPAATAWAELTPDQVVIIAMAQSETSRELAEYYAKARGIPESQVLLLDGAVSQQITRYQWDETYRPAILAWLKQQDFFPRIRCLTTTWDVPLQIAPINPAAPQITEQVAFLREARVDFVHQSKTLIRMLYSASGQPGAASTAGMIADNASLEDLFKQFSAAMKPTQAWLQSARSPSERERAGQFVDRALATISGNQGLARLAAPRDKSAQLTPEQRSRLAYLVGRSEGYQRGMESLNLLRDTPARDAQAIELTQTMGGLFGAIRWIDQQLYLLEKNFTGASFDSELSLILWHDPPVLSWVSNPWHYKSEASAASRRTTLMVARLSAPAAPIVRRMIDNAMTAEEESLQGTVYLDARGLRQNPAKPTGDVFTQYDASLRDLAERLRRHTSLKVVLDNNQDVFQLNSCPKAALYCGWHSLGRYVDAFEWTPGAVGYHLSSLEASWLQLNDDNRVQTTRPWCPEMLADGAAATLGSCQEAYLAAFPPPDEFFSLLLTGKYTLAETYYRTCPFLSWTTFLIGDPLYNPYKNAPKLSETALPEGLKPATARPVAPAEPSVEPEETKATGGESPPDLPPDPSPPAKPDEPEAPGILLPGMDP